MKITNIIEAATLLLGKSPNMKTSAELVKAAKITGVMQYEAANRYTLGYAEIMNWPQSLLEARDMIKKGENVNDVADALMITLYKEVE